MRPVEKVHETSDEPSPEELQKIEESRDRKSWVNLAIAAVIVIAFLAGVMLMRSREQPMTLAEMHAKNLLGKLDPKDGYMYNGYSFVHFGGTWFTQIFKDNKTYQVPMHFGPRDVENVTTSGDLNQSFGYRENYTMTFDPDDPNLAYVQVTWGEMGVSLTQIYGVHLNVACTKNTSKACEELPIGGCDLPGSVFYLRTGESPRIILQNNCVIIEGKGKDMLLAADRFLLVLYGVMTP